MKIYEINSYLVYLKMNFLKEIYDEAKSCVF